MNGLPAIGIIALGVCSDTAPSLVATPPAKMIVAGKLDDNFRALEFKPESHFGQSCASHSVSQFDFLFCVEH